MRPSDILRVEASLSEGKVEQKRDGYVWMIILLTITVFVTCYNLILVRYLSGTLKLVLTIVVYALIVPIILSAYKIIKSSNTLSKVQLWLKDAIEAEATIAKRNEKGGSMLEVTFVVDEVEHKQLSKPYGKLKNKVFAKYEDKTVTIFYSPSSDQVLLLK